MGLSIGKIASLASKAAGKIDTGSLLNGIDINHISADNISSVKGMLEGKLKEVSNTITSDLVTSITEGDVQSMIGNVDIESKVNSLIESAGLDSSAVDTAQVESMVNELMHLSSINIM